MGVPDLFGVAATASCHSRCGNDKWSEKDRRRRSIDDAGNIKLGYIVAQSLIKCTTQDLKFPDLSSVEVTIKNGPHGLHVWMARPWCSSE